MPDVTIGVDLGGTKLAVARREGGELAATHSEPTDTDAPDELVDQLVAAVERVRTPDVAAVGLGVPSVIDFATGTARWSVNVPLKGVPLRHVLRERLGLPVYVDNDATVAALAEAHDGDRLVVRDLVMLTVGTGLGGGLVLGGEVYRGATGAAGEIGHTIIAAALDGPLPDVDDPFPRPGSYEAHASGTAMDGLAAAAARLHPRAALGLLAAGGGQVRGADLATAARDGDPVAREAIGRAARALGVGIANMINIFDPEVVAIGGGASRAGDLLLGPARDAAARYVLRGVGTSTEIRLARQGADAGLRGAALMAGQELHKERTDRT